MKYPFRKFQNMPISRKLIIAGVVPTIFVLILAGLLFFIYESATLKKSLSRDLQSIAQFLALAGRASLTFEDQQSANDLLNGLQSNVRIVAAGIYNDKGELFASYIRTNTAIAIPEPPPSENVRTTEKTVEVVTPIYIGTKSVGSVYLASDLLAFHRRVLVYGIGVIVGILLFSAISWALASRMQRSISVPLNDLAQTAKLISENNDFNVRAKQQTGPELKLLTTAFNQMLAQIQRQDASLRARTSQLETTNKELEAFTYTVSHDLRAPLRAMSSYSHLIRKNFAATMPAEALDYLQRVQNNAQKMAELIDELLTFSRLDAEPLNKVPVNMTELFNELAEELLTTNKLQTCVQIDPLPVMHADPILIRQVVTNLLSNALKYSRNNPEAKVLVGSMKQDGHDVIFVQDNGVGFDMAYANKLFGVFQRLHSNKEFEGTGVGLAIVHRIIKRHNGNVWTQATLGSGATFYFYTASAS